MLLSKETTIQINDDYSNIISHMNYAAYKLWNVCNFERRNYQDLGLDRLEMHQQILSIFLLFFMLFMTVSGVLLFEFFVNILGDYTYKRLRNKYSYPVINVTCLAA